jgi:hypothetical protein
MVEHAVADQGYFRVLRDCEPVDFQRATLTEDRGSLAADSPAYCDHRLVCGPLHRRAGRVFPSVRTHTSGGVDYDDPNIDCRLGRARGNDGSRLWLCGTDDQRRRQRVAAVWRCVLLRRNFGRAGLDFEFRESRSDYSPGGFRTEPLMVFAVLIGIVLRLRFGTEPWTR